MGNLSDFFASGGGSNILEYIEFQADGRVVTTLNNGDVTTGNPTAVIAATTSYAQLPGSNFSYIPPADTKYVSYTCKTSIYYNDANNIGHFCVGLDGTLVTSTKNSWYMTNHYQDQWEVGGTIQIDSSFTDDLGAGKLSSWTTAKVLDTRFREYSSSYEFVANDRYYQDGGGTSGETRVYKPIIKIVAYK